MRVKQFSAPHWHRHFCHPFHVFQTNLDLGLSLLSVVFKSPFHLARISIMTMCLHPRHLSLTFMCQVRYSYFCCFPKMMMVLRIFTERLAQNYVVSRDLKPEWISSMVGLSVYHTQVQPRFWVLVLPFLPLYCSHPRHMSVHSEKIIVRLFYPSWITLISVLLQMTLQTKISSQKYSVFN